MSVNRPGCGPEATHGLLQPGSPSIAPRATAAYGCLCIPVIRDPSLSLKAQSQFLEHRVETEEDTVLEARAASENSPDSVLERRQASAEAVEEQSMGSLGIEAQIEAHPKRTSGRT